MASVNKVMLIGRLGKDPESKSLSRGDTITQFSLTTTMKYKDKYDQYVERVEWHSIKAWGTTGEVCSKHLKKGDRCYVEGKLNTESWEDDTGNKKYKTFVVINRVVFLYDQSNKSTKKKQNKKDDFQEDFDFDQSNNNDNEVPF